MITLRAVFLLIGIHLLYTTVSISAVQQNDSFICIHVTPLFFGFPSYLGHQREREPFLKTHVLTATCINTGRVTFYSTLCLQKSQSGVRSSFPLPVCKSFDMLGLDDLISKMSMIIIIPTTQQKVERVIAHIYQPLTMCQALL